MLSSEWQKIKLPSRWSSPGIYRIQTSSEGYLFLNKCLIEIIEKTNQILYFYIKKVIKPLNKEEQKSYKGIGISGTGLIPFWHITKILTPLEMMFSLIEEKE